VSETARALPKEVRDCAWTGCGRASDAHVAHRSLCLEHFFEFSHRRMDSIRRVLGDSELSRELIGDAHTFLSEVIAQTTQLATQVKLLEPALRDQLLSLSTSAAELYNRVRRAPRLSRRLYCLLRPGIASSEVLERCFTVNISQRGACLELASPQRIGREITLERLDTRQSARAKVAWTRQEPSGKYFAGVEILDSEDFWGLSVSAAMPGPGESS